MPSNLELAIMNFNFQKVHTIMTITGWTWGVKGKVPSIKKMKKLVAELYDNVVRGGNNWCSSGGFRVDVNEDGQVTIMFVLEEADSRW